MSQALWEGGGVRTASARGINHGVRRTTLMRLLPAWDIPREALDHWTVLPQAILAYNAVVARTSTWLGTGS